MQDRTDAQSCFIPQPYSTWLRYKHTLHTPCPLHTYLAQSEGPGARSYTGGFPHKSLSLSSEGSLTATPLPTKPSTAPCPVPQAVASLKRRRIRNTPNALQCYPGELLCSATRLSFFVQLESHSCHSIRGCTIGRRSAAQRFSCCRYRELSLKALHQ
jgi:hypothetical protein